MEINPQLDYYTQIRDEMLEQNHRWRVRRSILWSIPADPQRWWWNHARHRVGRWLVQAGKRLDPWARF